MDSLERYKNTKYWSGKLTQLFDFLCNAKKKHVRVNVFKRFSGCNQICTENQLLNGGSLMNNKKIIFDIVMYIIFGVMGLYLVSKTDFGTGVLVFIAILYLAVLAYKVKQVYSNSDS